MTPIESTFSLDVNSKLDWCVFRWPSLVLIFAGSELLFFFPLIRTFLDPNKSSSFPNFLLYF